MASWFLCLLIVAFAARPTEAEPFWLTETFHSLGVTKIPADQLLKTARETDLSSFNHHMFLLKALSTRQSSFSVAERPTSGAHDTRTQYVMKDNILLLDTRSPEVVRELSDRHILHCAGADDVELHAVKEGHLVVGSAMSSWFQARHLSSWAGASARTGLVLGRRVLRVEREGDCTRLHTEAVHHLTFFDSMRIESLVEHPAAASKADAPALAPAPAPSRNLQNLQVPTLVHGGNGMPDADLTPGGVANAKNQIKNCDPNLFNTTPWSEDIGVGYPYFKSLTSGATGIGIKYTSGSNKDYDYDFFFASTSGCASLTYTVNGMNFNWTPDPAGDPTKGKITKPKLTLDGVSGVECDGCYVYAGAQLYVIFEYKDSGSLFLAEIRVSGAAGFNVNVQIQDPAVQSSTDTQLVAPTPYGSTIPLGTTGLGLAFMMGGLEGSVSGQGGMKGSASFGAGLQVALTAGVLLSGKDLSFPIKQEMKWTEPFFKTTAFTPIGTSTLLTTLTATEFIKLMYSAGPVTVGVESKVDVIGRSGIGGGASTALVVVEPVSTLPSNSRGLKQAETLHLVPGSKINIKYVYQSLIPREKHRLFFSLRHSRTGRTETIMQRDFVNSGSGSGEHVAEWVVPWQSSLAGQNTEVTFLVRSSGDMMRDPAESDANAKITVTAYTESDHAVSLPTSDQVLPLNREFDVKWQPLLLHFFDDTSVGTPAYHGVERTARKVHISLVGIAEASGPADSSGSTRTRRESFALASHVPNNGHARVLLNSTVLAQWLTVPRKYWFEVRDAEFGSTFGWTKGYVQVARPRRLPASLQLALKSAAFASSAGQHHSHSYFSRLSSGGLVAVPPKTKTNRNRRQPERNENEDEGSNNANNANQARRSLQSSCDVATHVPVSTSFAFQGRPVKVTLSMVLEVDVKLAKVKILNLNVNVPIPSNAPIVPVGSPQMACINLVTNAATPGGAPPSGGSGDGGNNGASQRGSSSDSSEEAQMKQNSTVLGGVIVGVVIFIAGAALIYYFCHRKPSGAAGAAGAFTTNSDPDPEPSTDPSIISMTVYPSHDDAPKRDSFAANPMFDGQTPKGPSLKFSTEALSGAGAGPGAGPGGADPGLATVSGSDAPADDGLSWALMNSEDTGVPFWYCEATGATTWTQPQSWHPDRAYTSEQQIEYEHESQFQTRLSSSTTVHSQPPTAPSLQPPTAPTAPVAPVAPSLRRFEAGPASLGATPRKSSEGARIEAGKALTAHHNHH